MNRKADVRSWFALLALLVFLYGCQNSVQSVGSAADDYEGPAQVDMAGTMQASAQEAAYDNDLDRLGRLSARINAVCRSNYAVVLGAGVSEKLGSIISVDYGLFDRLSDEGVATMIAEAVVCKDKPDVSGRSVSPVEQERAVLSGDESAGRIVAGAGFGSEGFDEWLRESKLTAAGPTSRATADVARRNAFLRGYMAEGQVQIRVSN